MFRCKKAPADSPNNPQSLSMESSRSSDNESNQSQVGLVGQVQGVTHQESSQEEEVGDGKKVHGAKTAAMGVASITLFLLQPSLVKQFALLFSCTQVTVYYHMISRRIINLLMLRIDCCSVLSRSSWLGIHTGNARVGRMCLTCVKKYTLIKNSDVTCYMCGVYVYTDGDRFFECLFNGRPERAVLQLGSLDHGSHPWAPAFNHVRRNSSKTPLKKPL